MNAMASVAAALAGALTFAVSPPASAVLFEHVEWAGYGYAACTYGTSQRWQCTYLLYSDECVEASVFGEILARCSVRARVELSVVPIVDAAGRVIGCTSGRHSASAASHVNYDSTVNEFDNPAIDQLFVGQVEDFFADDRPSVMTLHAFEEGQAGLLSKYWLARATFVGTCRRGANYAYGSAAGVVDVGG